MLEAVPEVLQPPKKKGLSIKEIPDSSEPVKVQGPSGNFLMGIKTPNFISIYTPGIKKRYYMRAEVEDGILRLDLKTKNNFFLGLKKRHPDMFAGKFVREAIDYFENDKGYNLTAFKARWRNGSENYEQYQKALKNGKSIVEAAKSTWSGRILGKYGFTLVSDGDIEIQSVSYDEEQVVVYFHRNPQFNMEPQKNLQS